MFQLQNKGKEKEKKLVESKKPADVQKSDDDLLTILANKKEKLRDKLTSLLIRLVIST